MIPRECEWMVRAASIAVPRGAREAWLRKWDADLWFQDLDARRKGYSDLRVRLALWRRCLAVPADVLWHRYDREKAAHRTLNAVWSPWFCLGLLSAVVVAVLFASGWASGTRRSLFGPGWRDASRIAVVRSRDPIFPRMDPIPPALLERIRKKASVFEEVSAYAFWRSWIRHDSGTYTSFTRVLVGPEFFDMLGVKASAGRLFVKGDEKTCADCLVVTERFEREHAGVGQTMEFDGRKWRIIGRLPRGFWFLSPAAESFSVLRPESELNGVIGVVRLRPGVSAADADKDLHWFTPRDFLETTTLVRTLSEPVRIFGTATLVVLLIVACILGMKVYRVRNSLRYWLFFYAKMSLGMAAVLLISMEFTRVMSLTNVAVRTVGSELLAFWLWIAGVCLFSWWAIRDQHRRCRTCQRRLVLPVRVGPTDRVLFDHEGTELLCPAGHGTLYVEGATETFLHGEEWRRFDDSWKDLFR